MAEYTLQQRSRRVLWGGFVLAASLLVIHVIVVVAWFEYGKSARGLSSRFNLGIDASIPTWIASVGLIACAACLFVSAWTSLVTDPANTRHWIGLGVVFILLSIDEVARLHEWVGDAELADPGGGYFHYGWVVFGLAFVSAVAIWCLPFLRRLDRRTRALFLTSGLLYVGGALVLEMFNGNLASEGGEDTLRYGLQTGAEETLEVVGVVIFLYSLVDLLERRNVHAGLRVATVAEMRDHVESDASGI